VMEVKSVRCSLPNILFGINSRLIKSQVEIDGSLTMVGQILSEISEPFQAIHNFTRVDLVWQFRIDPELAVLAHRHARHPRIRSNVCRYENQSIYWRGGRLRIRMYDKRLEQ